VVEILCISWGLVGWSLVGIQHLLLSFFTSGLHGGLFLCSRLPQKIRLGMAFLFFASFYTVRIFE